MFSVPHTRACTAQRVILFLSPSLPLSLSHTHTQNSSSLCPGSPWHGGPTRASAGQSRPGFRHSLAQRGEEGASRTTAWPYLLQVGKEHSLWRQLPTSYLLYQLRQWQGQQHLRVQIGVLGRHLGSDPHSPQAPCAWSRQPVAQAPKAPHLPSTYCHIPNP